MGSIILDHNHASPLEQPGHSITPIEHVKISTVEKHVQAVARVIDWMHQQVGEPITLFDMADIANLSPCHFSRIFSRVAGISPSKFLMALRLQRAKHLLLTTSLSATDICFEVGYHSLGTFTTQFTQAVGISPARFRHFAEDTTLSGMDTLVQLRQQGLPTPTIKSGISGRAYMEKSFTGLIFIGLYPEPIPQGMPAGWAILCEPGYYSIPWIPSGSYWLFAAAFPWSSDPAAYLLPDKQHVSVGVNESSLQVTDDSVIGSTDILLRKLRPTDPPILSALPILLHQSLGALHDEAPSSPAT